MCIWMIWKRNPKTKLVGQETKCWNKQKGIDIPDTFSKEDITLAHLETWPRPIFFFNNLLCVYGGSSCRLLHVHTWKFR